MAIVAGFKSVKPGVSYQGQMVDYIVVDTNKRLHLMPFAKNILTPSNPIAMIDGTVELRQDMTPQQSADVFWLWESLKSN